MDDELEAFKTDINLTEYAAAEGYVMDRRASSRNSVAMHHTGGDKIIIARGHDQHWIFFSVRDDTDNGSIIDFVQQRKGVRLGGVRQALRPWAGSARHVARPHPDLFAHEIEPITKDHARILLELARMKPLGFHRYLEEGRCIPRALLAHPRFLGKLRIDHRMNAIFPHADKNGPCGYEIKNRDFTGYSKGGEKGLWFSAVRKDDSALVICESGIDALSYAALHPDDQARYCSTGGAMNPNQPELIRAAIARMGEGSRIILATDNDASGRELAIQIEALAGDVLHEGARIARDAPEIEGGAWSDQLMQNASTALLEPARG